VVDFEPFKLLSMVDAVVVHSLVALHELLSFPVVSPQEDVAAL
jgi:hypothetical protein